MKFAFNVPGYVMGHRFSSDKRYFDTSGATPRFLDLAGYGDLDQHCEQTSGVARFSLHGPNNREGLLLDNSNQWQVACPAPWEGCVVAVIKPHMPTLNKTLRFWYVGNNLTLGQNTGIGAASTGVAGVVNIAGSTQAISAIWPNCAITSDQLAVVAWSSDQETRQLYITKDAVNILTSAAVAASNHGRALALGAAAYAGAVGLLGDPKIKMERLGNNIASGSQTDFTADAVDYLHIFERHWFRGNPLRNNLPEMKEVFDGLKAYYGIP
jgi:hypothetical protein